jgi:hypothetical protein
VKKIQLQRVTALAPGIDSAALYIQKKTDLRSRYGGAYECHHQGEVVIFSVTQGRPEGMELWELFLLSGKESSVTLLMSQKFNWEEMDTKGRIEVDCHQDCRLLKVVVSADRMQDMLNTTELEILIEKTEL